MLNGNGLEIRAHQQFGEAPWRHHNLNRATRTKRRKIWKTMPRALCANVRHNFQRNRMKMSIIPAEVGGPSAAC